MSKMINKRRKNKLCYGVAINDADYDVHLNTPGGKVLCPFYQRWRGILRRVYDEKYLEKYPTYREVTVCEDWLTFSNFKNWMEKQDWEGKVLDKDILSKGRKIYSPETCAFVTVKTNAFLVNCSCEKVRGVSFIAKRGVYSAKCGGVWTKEILLGYHKTEQEAYNAWKNAKISLAKQLAKLETDQRIKQFLENFNGEFNA